MDHSVGLHLKETVEKHKSSWTCPPHGRTVHSTAQPIIKVGPSTPIFTLDCRLIAVGREKVKGKGKAKKFWSVKNLF